MKTKAILSFLLLLLVSSMQAQTPPTTPIPLPFPSPNPGPKPKSLIDAVMSMEACYTSDTLTVSITGYFGDVEVAIEEEDTATEMCTQTAYVNWQETITTAIQNLPTGNYILRIRLEDDEEYVGYFTK